MKENKQDYENLKRENPVASRWDKFYIVKPALFLHGVPVYDDTVLYTRNCDGDSYKTTVIANQKDTDCEDFYDNPIQALLDDYAHHSKYFMVKS